MTDSKSSAPLTVKIFWIAIVVFCVWIAWQATTLSAARALDATNTQMTVRVHSPAAELPVRLKIENSMDSSVSVITETTTTVANEWEHLTFDFADEVEGTSPFDVAATYDKIVIFFNFGADGATAGSQTFLIDDIVVANGGFEPIDFDDPALAYSFIGFGGAEDANLDSDPDEADNTVARVTRSAEAATYAGTIVSTIPNEAIPRITLEARTLPDHFGWLSVMPAVIALVICFVARNVVLALFMGVVLGGLITTDYNIIKSFLIPSLGTSRYAEILLVYLWALGGLLGMWNRNGGAMHFATWISENFVKSRRSALFFAWFMGVIFHQGGTISTILTGTTVRPVADREGVSHEELTYVVDSTASPVATIIPFNVWPVYVAGLIAIPSMSHFIADSDEAISWFLGAIPFNFYGWLAITFTLLFALDKLPFMGGAMRRARERASTTGELDRPGAEPMVSEELTTVRLAPGYQPSLLDFFVPIVVLMGVAIIPYLIIGELLIFEAFGLALVSGMSLSILRGMRVKHAFDGLIDGIKGVTVGAIILGLAVTLANVSETLGASAWVIASTSGVLNTVPFILPGLLMVICMGVSFSVGSSWGTYAVVFPIALPLAYAISADPMYVTLAFAAIMGGAVFGDQCSPISDTTILSSLACGCDLMDHVVTQLPMALAAAGTSIVLYTGIAIAIL